MCVCLGMGVTASTGREGGLQQVQRECLGRERWKLFCHAISLEGGPGAGETINSDKKR